MPLIQREEPFPKLTEGFTDHRLKDLKALRDVESAAASDSRLLFRSHSIIWHQRTQELLEGIR
jgi:hypothetical protein